jgi:hypothetical protein
MNPDTDTLVVQLDRAAAEPALDVELRTDPPAKRLAREQEWRRRSRAGPVAKRQTQKSRRSCGG